jgi:hypothetical protein
MRVRLGKVTISPSGLPTDGPTAFALAKSGLKGSSAFVQVRILAACVACIRVQHCPEGVSGCTCLQVPHLGITPSHQTPCSCPAVSPWGRSATQHHAWYTQRAQLPMRCLSTWLQGAVVNNGVLPPAYFLLLKPQVGGWVLPTSASVCLAPAAALDPRQAWR